MLECGSNFAFGIWVVGAVIVSDVEVMGGDFGNVGDLCFTLLYVFVAFDVELDSRFVGYVDEDLF